MAERSLPGLDGLLEFAVRIKGCTDIHVTPGRPITFRAGKKLHVLEQLSEGVDRDYTNTLFEQVIVRLGEMRIRPSFEEHGDVDFNLSGIEGYRFRGSVFKTVGGICFALRCLPPNLIPFRELGLPTEVGEFAGFSQGLILITGPTNSGKTTTLSAFVGLIEKKHVIMVEDPTEYHIPHGSSIIDQREIGLHTPSFARALRAALREDPNVIVVGEMRDRETMELALVAAETGHLVLGTLHTRSAHETVGRVLSLFPGEEAKIRHMLATSLLGVLSQRLVPRRNPGSGEPGLVVAYEWLSTNPGVRNILAQGDLRQLVSSIQSGGKSGMKLLDTHLDELVTAGKISPGDAIAVAWDPRAMRERYATRIVSEGVFLRAESKPKAK